MAAACMHCAASDTVCAQVDEALRMNTSDNVSVITVCLTDHAPPKRTYSGRQMNVTRTLSIDGLNRLGSALMTAEESAGVQL